jgi:hypothetical protein
MLDGLARAYFSTRPLAGTKPRAGQVPITSTSASGPVGVARLGPPVDLSASGAKGSIW